jgi:hypothetical protein
MGRRGHRRHRVGARQGGLAVSATAAGGDAGTRGCRPAPGGPDFRRRGADHAGRRPGGRALALEQADQVPAGKDRAALQADAVKTGATIALGTGGAAYLLLAYRRQRQEEIDTRERRITELYTTAVEQLGHEKAPVRLGALHSLERLAQTNPEHRQTVIDVLCAYLRMPYTPPTKHESVEKRGHGTAVAIDRNPTSEHIAGAQGPAQEELQVRQTAQRVIAAHLQLPEGTSSTKAQRRGPSPRRAFWPGISLNLTGATLVDLDFESVSFVRADFRGAAFTGHALFDYATVTGAALFSEATFNGYAGFMEVIFDGIAWFREAVFTDDTNFRHTTFAGSAAFESTIFKASPISALRASSRRRVPCNDLPG